MMMTGRRVNPLDPMASDVLDPFVEEWAERARKAQEALRAIMSGESKAPRVERRRRGKADVHVLVRRDGDEQRTLYGPEAREVTTVFSPEEWAAITEVVLRAHGLIPLPLSGTEQEGTP